MPICAISISVLSNVRGAVIVASPPLPPKPPLTSITESVLKFNLSGVLSNTSDEVLTATLPPSSPALVLLASNLAVLSSVTPLFANKAIRLFLGAVATISPVTVIFPASALTVVSRAFKALVPVPVILTSPVRTRYWRPSSKPTARLLVAVKSVSVFTSTSNTPPLPVPVAVPFKSPAILAVPLVATTFTKPALASPWLVTSTTAPAFTFTLPVVEVNVTFPAGAYSVML